MMNSARSSLQPGEVLSLERILELLRSEQPQIRARFRAEIVGVFGSFARGEQTDTSDLDILVRFREKASLFDLVSLGDYLEALLGRKVDIVSERAIHPEIRPQVQRELLLV
jgi:predicted nucleotidyltransferase